jgi:hypothetical protein
LYKKNFNVRFGFSKINRIFARPNQKKNTPNEKKIAKIILFFRLLSAIFITFCCKFAESTLSSSSAKA